MQPTKGGILAPANRVTELGAMKLKAPPQVVEGVPTKDRLLGKVSEKFADKIRAESLVLPKVIVSADVSLALIVMGLKDLLTVGAEPMVKTAVAGPTDAKPTTDKVLVLF